MPAQLKAYNFARGVNRTFAQLELPEGFVRDARNLLPRVPGGVQAVKGDTVLTSALATKLNDLFPFYTPSGSFVWVGRSAEAVFYSSNGITWNTLTGVPVTSVPGGLHSMCVYRGQLAIAEEGRTIKLWDGTTVTELTAGPYGGLVAEFAGCLCNLGESTAPTFPSISLPFYGTGVPLTAYTKLATGAGTIASNVVTPAPAPAWTVNAYQGKIVVLGGTAAYKVASNTATTFTVTPIDTSPADSASAVPFEIYNTDTFLEVYPKAAGGASINLGLSQLNADSDPVTFRLHNRSPVAVRVADIRAKGADFKLTEVPALPATVPPGGTVAFKAVMNPFSSGTVNGTIIIEHDLFCQSSIAIPVTGSGVTSAVLVTPSCVDFGEWMTGTASSPVAVQIKNTLKEAVTLPIAGWSAPSAPFAIVGGPTGDKVIQPGETFNFTATFTPSTTGTATGTLAATRTMLARRSRLRMSKPLDATKWDHDSDWIDVQQADSFTGDPVGLYNYDDSLLVFKESEIGALIVGGAIGYMYRQLTLGKGVGAMSQQAISSGNGSVFWVAKTGIYRMTAQTVEPIFLPVEDVVKAIASSDFPAVRSCFYDNCFLWTGPLPTGFIGDSVDKATWAYHEPTGSWWRLDGTASAFAVRRGISDKPAWYACYGVGPYTFAKKDAAAAAVVDFALYPGYIAGGEPGLIKSIPYAVLHTDSASQFVDGGLYLTSDNGDKVRGIVHEPASVVIYCGVGTCAGGTLTDAEQSWDADEVKGMNVEIDGASYAISGNTATVVSYAGANSGLHSYCIVAANPSAVIPVPCYLRECFGGAFDVNLVGQKKSTTTGNIFGLLLSIVPMGERVGEPGRG